MRAILAEARDEDPRDPHHPRPTSAERWRRWRAAVAALLMELSVEDAASRLLEERYLEGHSVVFPETQERWTRLCAALEELAGLGEALGRLTDGPAPVAPLDMEALRGEARVGAGAAAERMLATVRAHALDILGDVAGAAAIMEGALRRRA